jgi:hypothetical protein
MSELWQAESTMIDTTPTAWRAFLRAPVSGWTWRGLAYLIVCAPLAFASFWAVAICLMFGVGTAITFVGLPLIAVTVLGGRLVGQLQRNLGRSMVGARVDDPPPFRRQPGVFGWLGSALKDATGWRAFAYLVVKLPVAMAGAFGAALFWVESILLLTYPVWWSIFDVTNKDSHGVKHHSELQFGNFYFDTWPKALLLSAIGLVAVFLAPWPIRGLVALDGVLMRWLLGPTQSAQRVHELERTRAHAVDDSAAALRRIERDLHDGTQARLIALAMNPRPRKRSTLPVTRRAYASWSAARTRAPRTRSPSCATWSAASTRRCSTRASTPRWPRWPRAARCPSRCRCASRCAPRRRSRRSRTSA